MTIPQPEFDDIRRLVPLVAIDLIVQDADGRALLGRRKNEPAKDSWFVPGGRIKKDERLAGAFARIVAEELRGPKRGISADINEATFLGVSEHHYPAGEHVQIDGSVHYVVLNYRVIASKDDIAELPDAQHVTWKWFDIQTLLDDGEVHQNVKDYFNRTIHEEQYAVLADHRTNLNELLWQTPVLSLTAQAFLFTIAFNADAPVEYRVASIALVILVALASLQLMAKHRACEVHCMKLLAAFEEKRGYPPVHDYEKACIKLGLFTGRSSYRIWLLLMWLFVGAGLSAGYLCWRDAVQDGSLQSDSQQQNHRSPGPSLVSLRPYSLFHPHSGHLPYEPFKSYPHARQAPLRARLIWIMPLRMQTPMEISTA